MSPDPASRVLHDIDDALSRLRAAGMEDSLPNGTGLAMWAAPTAEAKRITADREEAGVLAWSDLLLLRVFLALSRESNDNLRDALLRVAAVATAWVEDIDRKAGK